MNYLTLKKELSNTNKVRRKREAKTLKSGVHRIIDAIIMADSVLEIMLPSRTLNSRPFQFV